jgi:hypothetical protein
MIKAVKKSKDSIALLIIEGGSGWGDLIQFCPSFATPDATPSKNGLQR